MIANFEMRRNFLTLILHRRVEATRTEQNFPLPRSAYLKPICFLLAKLGFCHKRRLVGDDSSRKIVRMCDVRTCLLIS